MWTEGVTPPRSGNETDIGKRFLGENLNVYMEFNQKQLLLHPTA